MCETETYQQQPDAFLSQANPASAVLYTVLATTARVRITSIEADVTWAANPPTPLEVVVTIDGITIIFIFVNPISATAYIANVNPVNSAATQPLLTIGIAPTAVNDMLIPFMLEGRSVKVEARITWAFPGVTLLQCRVKYARIP